MHRCTERVAACLHLLLHLVDHPNEPLHARLEEVGARLPLFGLALRNLELAVALVDQPLQLLVRLAHLPTSR
jgi:hypothetical protein